MRLLQQGALSTKITHKGLVQGPYSLEELLRV